MPTPRVLIVRAPGTNCDRETAFAFETAGAVAEITHLNRLRESPGWLADFQILCIPGGFSYGDDITAGRIFGNQMRSRLAGELQAFKAAGKLILGVCNGFQVLLKSGVLLPDAADAPLATLTFNESGKYEDRWVNLAVASEKCVFLRGLSQLYLPIAHAEGKFVTRDDATLGRLDAAGQLALRYCTAAGAADSPPSNDAFAQPLAYPLNPNGAARNVAGLCDETGRVFGLMPHPERHIDPTQHPRWTRQAAERGDGLALFENAVRYFA